MHFQTTYLQFSDHFSFAICVWLVNIVAPFLNSVLVKSISFAKAPELFDRQICNLNLSQMTLSSRVARNLLEQNSLTFGNLGVLFALEKKGGQPIFSCLHRKTFHLFDFQCQDCDKGDCQVNQLLC